LACRAKLPPKFNRRLNAGHGTVHRVRCEVDTARPFHAAEVGLTVTALNIYRPATVEKPAAQFGLDGIHSCHTIIKANLQTIAGKGWR